MATADPTRLGIAGCGNHSHVHAAAADELDDASIVCACDIDKTRADSWLARHGGERAYASLGELLTHPSLDGVILCTWPIQHAEQITACISAGVRNILCEKALFTSADEARHIRDLVQQHGTNLIEASMHRHHPAIRKLESILESGELGPVDCVRAAFHNYEPPRAITNPATARSRSARESGIESANHQPDWRERAECGGGVPYDWMHYLVDSCNHFSGDTPRRVFASGSVDSTTGVTYRVYGMIEYEGGAIGIIENSKAANFSNALQITCAHGILHLPIAWAIQGEVTITQTHRNPEWYFIGEKTHVIPKANAYLLQLEDFCRVIRNEGTPRVKLGDSVLNAVTTDALLESIYSGRAVDVCL
jgi:predicted dehydrogenase